MDLLRQVQRRTTKMIRRPEYIPDEDKLRELKLFSLKKGRLHKTLQWTFTTLREPTGKTGRDSVSGTVVIGWVVVLNQKRADLD